MELIPFFVLVIYPKKLIHITRCFLLYSHSNNFSLEQHVLLSINLSIYLFQGSQGASGVYCMAASHDQIQPQVPLGVKYYFLLLKHSSDKIAPHLKLGTSPIRQFRSGHQEFPAQNSVSDCWYKKSWKKHFLL